MRIGVINWDAGLPSETYFGGYLHRSLGNDKHQSRLPYFAKKDGDGFYIPVRDQKEYDRELAYAIGGGIDFFAYCWYPDTDPAERTLFIKDNPNDFLAEYYPEFNRARKLYQSSELNKRINMYAIIFSKDAYAESDLEALFEAMKQDYYERIDGRPLVLTFSGYDPEFISEVRGRAAQKGLDPFFAFISNGGEDDLSIDYSTADAITSYASCHGVKSFDELTELTDKENHKRLNCNLPIIPMLSMGWNPMPRIDNPCPWVTYNSSVPYADLPDKREIEYAFKKLDDFIKNHPEQANTGCAMVFAWNEFEEGGYLCPTYGKNGDPDDSLLRAFFEARSKRRDG